MDWDRLNKRLKEVENEVFSLATRLDTENSDLLYEIAKNTAQVNVLLHYILAEISTIADKD